MKWPQMDSQEQQFHISSTSTAQHHWKMDATDVHGFSDFYALLLASCTVSDPQNPAEPLTINLDLSRTTPLLRRAIKIAVRNKLNETYHLK